MLIYEALLNVFAKEKRELYINVVWNNNNNNFRPNDLVQTLGIVLDSFCYS